MKIRNILGLMAGVMVLSVSSCSNDDGISKGNYVDQPFKRSDIVKYTITVTDTEVLKDVEGNDSIVTRVRDVEMSRIREVLASKTGVIGLGASYSYGFVWSTTNANPDIYSDNVIYVDYNYPSAMVELQNGVITDTTAFTSVLPKGTPVNVRGFAVTYPERQVIYSNTTKFE